MLSLVIGGARSGKSRFAQTLCGESPRVVYLATARSEDTEMAARILRHRESRPAGWFTVEEPLEIAAAVERHAPQCDALLLDCLTLWLANFCWRHRDDASATLEAIATEEISRIASAAAPCHVVLVTNEVGCGIVPEAPIARLFRDLQGFVNQHAACRADWVYHMVAGIPVTIKQPAVRP
jgi:adenosylcobinamide kinase / adenosylcobinamide-phosphate guanylyltransferase